MGNLILETGAGDNFTDVSKQAKERATAIQDVEFEFNGIICIVSRKTNLERLYRDYCNAHTMDWKTVGADCVAEYSPEVQAELIKRKAAAEVESEKQRAEWEAKEEIERKVFEERVNGITIELKDADAWKKTREANTDPYGNAAVDYAEGWAKLMQSEIAKGITVAECAEYTSFELGFMGITGYMYGCAVSILSECWKYGEDLRKWHNKEYNHEGDGVVNPAILTVRS